MGTLNLLPHERTAQVAALVRDRRTVSCARPILSERAPDVRIPTLHFISGSCESVGHPGSAVSSDFFGVAVHGSTVTHVDSICHALWNGKMYNDHPASLVTTLEGTTAQSIELLHNGIVGRGALLDITRLRGVECI